MRRTPPQEATPCLTIRDAELGCARECEPLQPVVQTCASALAVGDNPPATGYRVVVHATSDGRGGIEGVRTELPPSSSASLRAVAACIARAFRRFVPCVPVQEGQPIVVPLRVTAGTRR